MDAAAGVTHRDYNDDIARRIQVTVTTPFSTSPETKTHSSLQITLLRSLARYVKYATILPTALIGCGLAFCALLMWVGMLYALRCLLLVTAALLRECIDFPDLDAVRASPETAPKTVPETIPETISKTVPVARAELDKRFIEEMMAKSPKPQSPQDVRTGTVTGRRSERVDSPLGRYEGTSRWEEDPVWYDETCDGEPVAPWNIAPLREALTSAPVASWNVAPSHETAIGSANGSTLGPEKVAGVARHAENLVSPAQMHVAARTTTTTVDDERVTAQNGRAHASNRPRPSLPKAWTPAEKQSSWLASMSAGSQTPKPTRKVQVGTSRAPSTLPSSASQNIKPSPYTPGQLAEAVDFMRSATRGGQKQRPAYVGSTLPARPPPWVNTASSTIRRQAAGPVHAPATSARSSAGPLAAVSSFPQQVSSSQPSPALAASWTDVVPPHLRAQRAAIARKSGGGGGGGNNTHSQTTPGKAGGPAVALGNPNMYDILAVESPTASASTTPQKPAIKANTVVTRTNAGSNSTHVAEEKEHAIRDVTVSSPSVTTGGTTRIRHDATVEGTTPLSLPSQNIAVPTVIDAKAGERSCETESESMTLLRPSSRSMSMEALKALNTAPHSVSPFEKSDTILTPATAKHLGLPATDAATAAKAPMFEFGRVVQRPTRSMKRKFARQEAVDVLNTRAAHMQVEHRRQAYLTRVPDATAIHTTSSGRKDSVSLSGFHGDDLLDLDYEPAWTPSPSPRAASSHPKMQSDLRPTALPFVAPCNVSQPISALSVSTVHAERAVPISPMPPPCKQTVCPGAPMRDWTSNKAAPQDLIDSSVPQSMPAATRTKAPPGLAVAEASWQEEFDSLLAAEPRMKSPEDEAQITPVRNARPPSWPLQALPKEATSALPESEEPTETVEEEPSFETSNTTSAPASRFSSASEGPSKPTMTKRETKTQREAARSELARAWWAREDARKQLLGTWSLEAQQVIDAATFAYNEQRTALQDLMGGGQLNSDDAAMYPTLLPRDLSAPKIRPPFVAPEALPKADETQPTEEEVEVEEPWVDLCKKAEAALALYRQACTFFDRPPPQGRKSLKGKIADGKASVSRAKNYYRKRREVFELEFPDHEMLKTALPKADDLEEAGGLTGAE
ncbi:hypothetical protein LTR74_004270 [Friedmanniomyces endolithicus]|nr:hypothetical protein LTR74_004270 [Friedmanniomyces endolithicus]